MYSVDESILSDRSKADLPVEAALGEIPFDYGADPAELVVVASRLPVAPGAPAPGGQAWEKAPGGVATALSGALRQRPSTWIGWSGATGPVPVGLPAHHGASMLRSVDVSAQEATHYFERFCNAALWPVLHGWAPTSQLCDADWDAYRTVNERFAQAAAEVAAEGAQVWVHDYQLMLVPGLLRSLRPDLRIGFFLHTPMPQGRAFARVDRSSELIEGLLGSDVIGFQRQRDVFHFAADASLTNPVRVGRHPEVSVRGRTVTCAAHPISVDTRRLAAAAMHPRVQARAREIRASVGRGRTMVLGVDRLDYTKGIPTRLRAFRHLMEDGTLGAGDAVFVQIAVPTRAGVSGYTEAQRAVEHAVANANRVSGVDGASSVLYRHTSLSHEELLAHYVAADLMCVTPLKDGMNLVAKEFIAVCRPDAALVLSAEAGAAEELGAAWIVDPHDVGDVKRGLFEALQAEAGERAARVTVMRRRLWHRDVHSWAAGFLRMLEHDDV